MVRLFLGSVHTQSVIVLVASLVPTALAPMPSARAADVTIVTTFPADKGPGYRKPYPDAAGAVGPKHTAVLDDRAFVVQDKATGKVLQNDTQHEFWLKVLPAKTFDLQANDPRLLYDPITQALVRLGSRAQPGQRIPGRFDDLRSDQTVAGSQNADPTT